MYADNSEATKLPDKQNGEIIEKRTEEPSQDEKDKLVEEE